MCLTFNNNNNNNNNTCNAHVSTLLGVQGFKILVALLYIRFTVFSYEINQEYKLKMFPFSGNFHIAPKLKDPVAGSRRYAGKQRRPTDEDVQTDIRAVRA